jgi:SAM-dependent methyltransferase
MRLDFRRKAHLPDQILLYDCPDCDLAFTSPRERDGYERYYGQVANDFITVVDKFRNLKQRERLSRIIAERGLRRILDFGCGGGGLVSELAARHVDVDFVGYDVNGDFPPGSRNLCFNQNLPEDAFDLVILSHVLEHATDPVGLVLDIKSRLHPSLLYIEVPDPHDYISRGQPQHLYYVDRLHINHFSLQALTRAVGGGDALVEYGKYDMPYELGPVFPCQYALFAMAHRDVAGSLMDYVADQARKALALSTQLEHRRFFIYGFGDNFFRNRLSGGPLAGLEANILGIIDRDIEALLSSELLEDWTALHPDNLASVNGELIICTVTQSGGLDALFAALCPDSEIIYL